MTAPRLEIDLDKVSHNARTLVKRLAVRGITVTGVTKAALGSAEIANVFLQAGIGTLGDSRIENIEAMRIAGIDAPVSLIRSPMLSQTDRVVASADVSFNTEIRVIKQLSTAAEVTGKTHGIVLMVELGDLREGIMLEDVTGIVRETLRLPNIVLRGLGTNLACRCGVTPSEKNMAVLSELVDSVEEGFGLQIEIVSGGNSANLNWALSNADVGRVNDLRLGESILLGREPLHRQPIDGLHTDAMALVAEVIESKIKPSQPWGEFAQTAYGDSSPVIDRGQISQAILAIGRQDTDPTGLISPMEIEILAASSDHLIVRSTDAEVFVGTEIAFQPNYSALCRAMTSPYVAKVFHSHFNCHVAGRTGSPAK